MSADDLAATFPDGLVADHRPHVQMERPALSCPLCAKFGIRVMLVFDDAVTFEYPMNDGRGWQVYERLSGEGIGVVWQTKPGNPYGCAVPDGGASLLGLVSLLAAVQSLVLTWQRAGLDMLLRQ